MKPWQRFCENNSVIWYNVTQYLQLQTMLVGSGPRIIQYRENL